MPDGVGADIRRAIDDFNGTAGGPPAVQQRRLRALLASGQLAPARRCAPATTTIEFDPVYSDLAPAPDWRPSSGSVSGTVYSLPTLIRIYTGTRITGTDLTDLHLAVDGGKVRFPALCVN